MKSKAGLSLRRETNRWRMRIVSLRRSRRLPQKERPAWIKEANRLARIVEHYATLRPKRRRHPLTGHYEFVPDAFALCQQAACRDPVILDGSRTGRVRPPRRRSMTGSALFAAMVC